MEKDIIDVEIDNNKKEYPIFWLSPEPIPDALRNTWLLNWA